MTFKKRLITIDLALRPSKLRRQGNKQEEEKRLSVVNATYKTLSAYIDL